MGWDACLRCWPEAQRRAPDHRRAKGLRRRRVEPARLAPHGSLKPSDGLAERARPAASHRSLKPRYHAMPGSGQTALVSFVCRFWQRDPRLSFIPCSDDSQYAPAIPGKSRQDAELNQETPQLKPVALHPIAGLDHERTSTRIPGCTNATRKLSQNKLV